jgi:hypothetical protein
MPVAFKRCSHPGHDGDRWTTIDHFWVKERHPDGAPRLYQSWCKECHRKSARVRVGLARRGEPYEERKPARSHTPEAQRERYRNLTPEQRQARRERQNFWANDQRRKAGIPPRRWRKSRDSSSKEWLDPAPFLRWLRDDQYEALTDNQQRVIRRAREEGRIEATILDRLLVLMHAEHMLIVLYPGVEA